MVKTVDEFKRAFSAFKKPSRPKAVSSKLKGALEKAVTDEDETEFANKLGEIGNLDPAYLVDLVAYKFGKHLDDGKMPTWHKKVPADIRQKALAKIVPGGLETTATQRLMKQSIDKGDIARMELLVERDPANAQNYFSTMPKEDMKALLEKSAKARNETINAVLAKALHVKDPDGAMQYLLEEKDKADELRKTSRDLSDNAGRSGDTKTSDEQIAISNEQNFRSQQFGGMLGAVAGNPDPHVFINEYLLARKDDTSTKRLLPGLGNLPPKELEDLALKDPEHFIDGVLSQLDSSNLVRLLSRPGLRDALAKAAPDEWDDYTDSVPMLRVYKSVGDTRKKDKKSGNKDTEQLRDVGALFDTMMDGGITKPAYIGTNVGTSSDIIMKPNDPVDPPRTDCHNALTLLQLVIKGYPGLVPGIGDKLKHGNCHNMLMTKPLSAIGVTGRGMIDKTFTGNVFNDAGAPTGQILFTGANGVDSHSWLEAGGQAYDPVLGISGTVAEIKDGSTFQTFDWAIDGKVGKGGDWYFIVADEDLLKVKPTFSVAANKMSFNKAYILTKTPAAHLKDEFAQQL